MKNARGNRSQERPRDADGRFESKNQANQEQSKPKSNKAHKAGGPCRNDMGRFESCE